MRSYRPELLYVLRNLEDFGCMQIKFCFLPSFPAYHQLGTGWDCCTLLWRTWHACGFLLQWNETFSFKHYGLWRPCRKKRTLRLCKTQFCQPTQESQQQCMLKSSQLVCLKVYFHHPSLCALLHQESHLNYGSSSCFTEAQNTCYLTSHIKLGLTPVK